MQSDRFRLSAAVYGVLVQDRRVLLMRRAGSGYRDGQRRPSSPSPDKCTELVWADVDHLPADAVDYVVLAVEALQTKKPLVLFGWPAT